MKSFLMIAWFPLVVASLLVIPVHAPQADMCVYEEALASSVTVLSEGGVGAGFSVGPGLIVTARHVVEGANTILISPYGGGHYPVTDMHLSPDADIAILEYFGPDVPAVTFGGPVRIGDEVFAIGSPGGVRHYVTRGVVSALGRDFGDFGDDILMTDAALNHGSSGGALFNMNGEVVGMAIAIARPFHGLGLCLPAGEVQREIGRREVQKLPAGR